MEWARLVAWPLLWDARGQKAAVADGGGARRA